jgi:uncharacterized OsmC-like protein
MRLVMAGEERVRLETGGDGFEMVAEGAGLSPFHLVAGGLASCTALTLQAWAQPAGVPMDGVSITVDWQTAPAPPKRIVRIDLAIDWPGLPERRVATAERVAALCPIHDTLQRAASVTTQVRPTAA